MISEAIYPKLKSGATVRVFERVKEGDKERISRFEGLILGRKHGSEPGATFTVRALMAGVGVEKVFPLHSPTIEKVEVLSSPRKVSRSKLYYIRTLSRRATQQKMAGAKISSSEEKELTASEEAPAASA
jgi:large subunit ribosomal protein L19